MPIVPRDRIRIYPPYVFYQLFGGHFEYRVRLRCSHSARTDGKAGA